LQSLDLFTPNAVVRKWWRKLYLSHFLFVCFETRCNRFIVFEFSA
jgi:hypothetical protein